MLLEWANLGYLSLSVTRQGRLYCTRLMAMGSERSQPEQKLFARIFRRKRRVALTSGRFAAAGAQFRRSSTQNLSRVIFDRTGGNLLLVQWTCQLLLGVGCGYLALQALPEGAGFVVLGVLLGFLGLLYSRLLHQVLAGLFSRRKVFPPSLGLLVCLPLLAVAGLLTGALLEVLTGIVAIIFSALVTAQGPRRSQRGLDALAQARGCQTFYRQVTWSRLQILQGANSQFFQSQFPVALALGVEKRFAKRFEHIPVPIPEWLGNGNGGMTTASTLQPLLTALARQIREAFR
jgi:hypothetical protein